MITKGRKALVAALALPAAILPAAAWGDADYFLHGYYIPAMGRVGQAFHADAAFGVDDMPNNCIFESNDIAISGALPPGLAAANPGSVIAGTPSMAGNWPVTITFHALGCTNNSDYRVDRVIKVVFHIAP